MLLDLNLDASAFSEARALLEERNVVAVDFPAFLELYCNFSGLAAPEPLASDMSGGAGGGGAKSALTKKASGAGMTTMQWVPGGSDGKWRAVKPSTARKVRNAAEPYSISAAVAQEKQQPSSVFLLPPSLRVLRHADEEAGNVWVKGEDLSDILMIAGLPATDDSVDEAVSKLRNFLPGIITGKFCLQV